MFDARNSKPGKRWAALGWLGSETGLEYAGVVGVVLTYSIALANKKLKLGLLSKMAEKVVLVLVPPGDGAIDAEGLCDGPERLVTLELGRIEQDLAKLR